jgi:hypothetical protein
MQDHVDTINIEDLEDLTNTVRSLTESVQTLLNSFGCQPGNSYLSVNAARRMLGDISRASIYRMIQAGEVESVRLRGRRLISAASIQRLIASTEHDEA